jgi:hypothetical protein
MQHINEIAFIKIQYSRPRKDFCGKNVINFETVLVTRWFVFAWQPIRAFVTEDVC